MPSYISKSGVLVPAKEHVVLPHLSGTANEVYDGPDRAAEEELALAGGVDAAGKPIMKSFGIHYKNDNDIINRARSLGYKDVKEYVQAMGYNDTPEQEKASIIEKEKIVVNPNTPIKRNKANSKLGGGTDTSGQGNDKLGGFGNDPDGLGKR
jgi:hypothetical protein